MLIHGLDNFLAEFADNITEKDFFKAGFGAGYVLRNIYDLDVTEADCPAMWVDESNANKITATARCG